jgi:hypothetical protein
MKEDEMARACRMYGREEKTVKDSVRQPDRKGPLVSPRRSWEDNIEMDMKEIGLKRVNWIHLAQDKDYWRALVNTIMNLRAP